MSGPKNARCRVSLSVPFRSPLEHLSASDLAADHWIRSPFLSFTLVGSPSPRTAIYDLPRFAPKSVHSTPNIQNFNDEGVGVCDSGEYCRFVHPGPRWADARPYNRNSFGFDHIPKAFFEGGGGGGSGGGRGRPGGGGGGSGGKGSNLRRCRVSLFGSLRVYSGRLRLHLSRWLSPSGASDV